MIIDEIKPVTGVDPNGEGEVTKIWVSACFDIDELTPLWGKLGDALRAANKDLPGDEVGATGAEARTPHRWTQFIKAQRKSIEGVLGSRAGWHKGSGPADSAAGEVGTFQFDEDVSVVGGPGDFPGFALATISIATTDDDTDGAKALKVWDEARVKMPGLGYVTIAWRFVHMAAGTLDTVDTYAQLGAVTIYDMHEVLKAGDADTVHVPLTDAGADA